MLEVKILPAEFKKELQKLTRTNQPITNNYSLNESLTEYEERLVHDALVESNWNQSKAARMLKISEHAIRYKMNKLGIKKDH